MLPHLQYSRPGPQLQTPPRIIIIPPPSFIYSVTHQTTHQQNSLQSSTAGAQTPSMAAVALLLLFSSMAARASATWCICKDGISDTVLQKTLDYACGAGADCNPTHQNGPCFNPNTVRAHCSYAVNSYFQRYRQTPTACDFSGTAAITNSDPSMAGCAYPATASSTTPVTTVPGTGTNSGTGTPSTTVSNGGSPFLTNPNTGGILGGTGNGLGPTGTDFGNEGIRQLPMTSLMWCSSILALFTLIL